MSLARALPVLGSLAAILAPAAARAQSQPPWSGAGITAREEAGRGSTRFIVRVENVSTGDALQLSNGASAPFVSAPVLWVIHTGGANPIFAAGERDAGDGLEQLAETGDPSKLVASLSGKPGVVAAGAAARPIGADADGPITPGRRYEFQISVQPGQLVSTAWMFGQSNDLFYSNDRPIALFDAAGEPRSVELTTRLSLWDAGTEVNEEPGLGPNQGPRQASPDAGVTESQGIAHVRDRYGYPRISEVLRLAITPAEATVSSK